MKIFSKGKPINLQVKKLNLFGKFSGLMFRTKQTENLMFEFRKTDGFAIHSFFVFFKFLAVWLDHRNHVLSSRIVFPFTPFIKSPSTATKLLELPFNEKNLKKIQLLVGKGKV